MKFIKSTLGLLALGAVVFFSACGSDDDGGSTVVQLTPMEIIAGKQGSSITWVAQNVSENGDPVNAGGFEITFTFTSQTTADYSINGGTLDQAYWPNFNKTDKTAAGSVTLDGTDNITFDAGSAEASPVTFGGVAPTESNVTLEWTVTTDKTLPEIRMILAPKN